jgi:hypothetical protein
VRGSQMAFGACLVAVLVTTSLTAGAAWGATGGLPGTGDESFNPAADSESNHCVSPEGVDANELLGISEYLVVPGACDAVKTGEFYVPLTSPSWTMSPSWEEVPADYTPSAPTPLEDFLSKVRSARESRRWAIRWARPSRIRPYRAASHATATRWDTGYLQVFSAGMPLRTPCFTRERTLVRNQPRPSKGAI